MKTVSRVLMFVVLLLALCCAFGASAQTPVANVCTVTAQTHGIQLLWGGPSIPPPVLSYNVYRSTTTTGPYTKIGSVPVGTGTCLDSTGVVGTKYFYVVSSVNADGESGFSNEASAIAPTLTPPVPPNKPGNLRATPK